MKIFLFPVALLLTRTLIAQQLQPLQIGDLFPDLYLKKVLDHKEGIHTKDYKGKKVLIEFWSTRCVSCIRNMPDLEKIQEQYKDQLQVIMVTYQSQREIDSVFKKRKWRLPNLLMVVSDSLLHTYFPHVGVPFGAWIDASGKVEQLSGSSASDPQSLHAWMRQQPVRLLEKKMLADINRKEPIWKEGNGRLAHHVKYYSMLFDYVEEHGTRMVHYGQDRTHFSSMRQINVHLLDLYRFAYCGGTSHSILKSTSRMRFEVKDPTPLIFPEPLQMDSLKNRCFVGYEIQTAPMKKEAFYKLVQQDLDRYFPYSVSIEKRVEDVYILQPAVATDTMNRNGKMASFDMIKGTVLYEDGSSAQLSNNVRQFLDSRNLILAEDVTNWRIGSLLLKFPFTTVEALQQELKDKGWLLTKGKQAIDMLVFRDKE